MIVYIVVNTNPDFQIFNDYEKAKEFALEKANKKRCVNVWLDWEEEYNKACLNKEVNGERHIYIYKRKVQKGE